jgi:hypothetical protein
MKKPPVKPKAGPKAATKGKRKAGAVDQPGIEEAVAAKGGAKVRRTPDASGPGGALP